MQPSDFDKLIKLYENTLPAQKFELAGSFNTNAGTHQNKQALVSIMPVIRQVRESGGHLTDLVKHLKDQYDISYNNLDVEIQQEIIRLWKEVTGEINPKMR